MRRETYINGVEGVASGATANIFVPLERRIHDIRLFVAATGETLASAIVDNVRIFVNSVVMRDAKAEELQNIAKLNGLTVDDLEIPIYFSEPWRVSVTGEEATSWDVFGQKSMTIEVTFKSGLTSPSLQALHSFDFGRNTTSVNGNQQSFLSIVKQTPSTFNGASGINDITSLPTTWPITRIYVIPSTGNTTLAEVFRDDEKVFEATKAQNAILLEKKDFDASAFEYPIVFDADQQVSNALVVRNNLLVRLTQSASASLRLLVERRANGFV